MRLALAQTVCVSMGDIAEDVSAECGPKGKHDPGRTSVRHGTEHGSVTLGGWRVPVERPRMRAADGSRELAVPSYGLLSGTEVPGRMAMQRMLAGLSTRRYPVGLEPVGARVEASARSTSKSAVSPVRRRYRDCAGRPARRSAGRVGPGGADDRRGARR